MQTNPKISVIIPVYNVQPYLRQCLDSVVNQTYQNLEILIIDDGSPDDCGAICDEYAQKDERIIVIHKKNGGLSAARNEGLARATGEWISFIDSDDWCELDLYEKAIENAEKTNADIVMYSFYRGSSQKAGNETRMHTFDRDYETEDGEALFRLQLSALSRKYIPYSKTQPWPTGFPWDKLFKASLIFDNKLTYAENVKAHEDVIFNIHAFQHARKVSFFDLPLYHWRVNPASIGHKYSPNRIEISNEIYRELFKIGAVYHLPGEYYNAINLKIIEATYKIGSLYIFNSQNPAGFWEKLKCAKQVLRSEPTYTAFEKADRKKLGKIGRFMTLSRHHNAFLLFLAVKLSEVIH